MKIFRAVENGMEIPDNLEELVLPEEKPAAGTDAAQEGSQGVPDAE